MSNRVILIDHLAWRGHHPIYNFILGRFFLESGYSTVQIVEKPDDHYQRLVEAGISTENLKTDNLILGGIPKFVYHLSGLIQKKGSLRGWVLLYFLLKRNHYKKSDLVFLVSGDGFLQVRHVFSRMLLPERWVTLMMFLKCEEINRYGQYAEKLFHLNEETVLGCQKHKLVRFPDITIDEYAEVPEIFEKGKKVIGLCGGLSKRKGLLRLLRISKKYDQINFLFMGRIIYDSFDKEEQVEIREYHEQHPDHVKFILNVEDDLQFNGYLRQCDFIYCAYEDFNHSSNILTKTAKFNIPVLSLINTYIGRITKKYKMGLVLPDLSGDSIINSLDKLRLTSFPKEGFNKYYNENNLEKLKQVLEGVK